MITEMPITLEKADWPSRLMEGRSGLGGMAHPDNVITLRLCYNDCGEIEAGGPAFLSQGDRWWVPGSRPGMTEIEERHGPEAQRRCYCITIAGFATELHPTPGLVGGGHGFQAQGLE